MILQQLSKQTILSRGALNVSIARSSRKAHSTVRQKSREENNGGAVRFRRKNYDSGRCVLGGGGEGGGVTALSQIPDIIVPVQGWNLKMTRL